MKSRFNLGRIKPDAPLTYLLPILGVLLLVLVWTALFDYLGREKALVDRNAGAEAAGHARTFARYTENLLLHVDQVTRVVQYEFEKSQQSGEPFELAAMVRREVIPLKGLLQIALVDRNGVNATVTIASATAAGTPGTVPRAPDRERLAAHRDNPSPALNVGMPETDPRSGRQQLPLTRRLNKRDGSFAGVVAVTVDPALFTDFYDVAGLGANGVVSMLGRDGGTRVLRTGGGTREAAATDYAMALATLRQAERLGVPVEDPADHVRRYVGFRILDDYPLMVRVGRSEEEMLAGYERQKDRYLFYAVLISLAIVGVFATVMIMVYRLRQSHRESETNRATFKAAAEGSLDALLLLRSVESPAPQPGSFVVADANSRAGLLLNLPPEQIMGRRFTELVPAAADLYRTLDEALATGSPMEEELEIAIGGRPARWFRHQVVPLKDGVAVTLRDIDDEKHARAELVRLVHQDSLTTLPNRRSFIEHAGGAIDRCRAAGTNLCVLFLDLDNFKSVNDSLGHDVGDLLLQAVAGRLKSCVRSHDIIWRLGGDEFIVTMEDLRNRDEAEVICRRIADAFGPPIVIREISISTSASIGVAFCPEDAQDANALLRNADLAMYHAKEFGSGAYQFFTPAMGVRRAARVRLEQAMRVALGRYEMFLVYQPQIDLADRRITGLEALVRWQHPENGVMLPQEFIPIAEESNLIHLLGDHIFQLACTQLRRWQVMGLPPIPISVNLSARQFQWDGIVERLLRVVKMSGVSPDLVQIELTESAIMKDSDAARRKLSELKQHGIALSIDDFGTGHSSLALLQTFPIDTLKIDRSFIEKSGTREGAAILRAIVLMAHTLQMRVVAEGVETEAQYDVVRATGCDMAQGFLFAIPVVAAEVPALLDALQAHSERSLQAVVAAS